MLMWCVYHLLVRRVSPLSSATLCSPVSSVTVMSYMFNVATSFDQDISKWDGKLSTVVACCLDFAAAVSIIRKDDSIYLVSSCVVVLV
jgi:hypothetical protein